MAMKGLVIASALVAAAWSADIASAQGAPAAPAGQWLLGSWVNPYNTLTFTREGSVVTWVMSRVRHPSQQWSMKDAAEFSGTVVSVSETAVELDGRYDVSTNPRHVGARMQYWLTREGADVLSGEGLGVARTPFPVSFRRAPRASTQ
ncbi:MAG: hypothetical protein AAB265_04850 [candidate division NC10 bacterium]